MYPILELHRLFRRQCVTEDGLSPSYVSDMEQTILTFIKLVGA